MSENFICAAGVYFQFVLTLLDIGRKPFKTARGVAISKNIPTVPLVTFFTLNQAVAVLGCAPIGIDATVAVICELLVGLKDATVF